MKRKSKDEATYPCFISLFQIHEPHQSGQAPEKIIDYEHIKTVFIKNLDVNYQLAGNDLILDNLEELSIEEDGEVIIIKGRQKK